MGIQNDIWCIVFAIFVEALTTTNEETRVEYHHVKIMGLLVLIRIHHQICWMIGLGFHGEIGSGGSLGSPWNISTGNSTKGNFDHRLIEGEPYAELKPFLSKAFKKLNELGFILRPAFLRLVYPAIFYSLTFKLVWMGDRHRRTLWQGRNHFDHPLLARGNARWGSLPMGSFLVKKWKIVAI